MTMRRICVVGAGAIGGLLAARLAASGVRVSVLEKGDRLASIRHNGFVLLEEGSEPLRVRDVSCSDRAEELGPQDLVILAVKAHDIAAVAPVLPHLYTAETPVVTVQNGLPWWYFMRHGGPHEGRRLGTLDPTGMIEEHIPIERVIGCVAYPAAELDEKGAVRLVEGNRFPVGEPSGEISERVTALVDALTRAGFKSFALSDIRAELWLKAWGALAFNPISTLTGATMAEICQFPATRSLVRAVMEEAQQIASQLGVTLRVPLEKRLAGAEAVGHHKTSMLQDLEAGREFELNAVVAVFSEIAQMVRVGIPTIDAIHACLALLAKQSRNSLAAMAP